MQTINPIKSLDIPLSIGSLYNLENILVSEVITWSKYVEQSHVYINVLL